MPNPAEQKCKVKKVRWEPGAAKNWIYTMVCELPLVGAAGAE